MPNLFPSGLGALSWCHIPGARAGLGPKAGLSRAKGSREDMPANEPRLGPGLPGALGTCPPSPDPGGPSYSETKQVRPKDGGAHGLEELRESPGLHASLGSPHLPTEDSTLSRVVTPEWGLAEGRKGRKG